MTHAIYIIEHTASARRYVGSAVDVDNRLSSHRSLLRARKHPNSFLQAAWNKYGEEAFQLACLEIVKDKADLIATEQAWMDALSAVAPQGFNLAPKAGSTLGRVYGPEYRKRVSELKRGNTYRLGKRHSEETKRLLAELSRGRTPSVESRAKRSASMLGKKNATGTKQTPESNKKRSEALKAYYASPERRALQRAKWVTRMQKQSARVRAA